MRASTATGDTCSTRTAIVHQCAPQTVHARINVRLHHAPSLLFSTACAVRSAESLRPCEIHSHVQPDEDNSHSACLDAHCTQVLLGTGSGQKGNVTDAVRMWLGETAGVGIDTAYDYEDEALVAAGVAASGKPWSAVFLETKIPCGTCVARPRSARSHQRPC